MYALIHYQSTSTGTVQSIQSVTYYICELLRELCSRPLPSSIVDSIEYT
jgi:hypothetical protein